MSTRTIVRYDEDFYSWTQDQAADAAPRRHILASTSPTLSIS